jgi:ArsR family transcriptional regulator
MIKTKNKTSGRLNPKRYQYKKLVNDLFKTAEFLKIIAEKNRLKILYLLQSGEKCVCEIWQYLDLPQNLVSHHLKALKNFNFIKSRKQGLNVYYSINKKELSKLNSSLNKFL